MLMEQDVFRNLRTSGLVQEAWGWLAGDWVRVVRSGISWLVQKAHGWLGRLALDSGSSGLIQELMVDSGVHGWFRKLTPYSGRSRLIKEAQGWIMSAGAVKKCTCWFGQGLRSIQEMCMYRFCLIVVFGYKLSTDHMDHIFSNMYLLICCHRKRSWGRALWRRPSL